MTVPSEPVIFMKATTCINGPHDPIIKPRGSTKLDWEVELGLVIGREARDVSVANAMKHVAGYCVFNDVSERQFQLERGGGWDKGKGCDSFGPIGPWLVTAHEIPDPQNLRIWLEVNGQRMQDGTTADMIFPCAEIVSYVSRFMTLLPGDLIATGTPPGVGMGRGVYLDVGDTVRLGIDGLGEQCQTVIAAR
jgi:2-keto-4-pentenoate hydratase/2-oxohepta-3-ene-1,7-dioic acid hydratase in catechol pathway